MNFSTFVLDYGFRHSSKLFSNSELLLIKLEVRLTAFKIARAASEILMIKRKTEMRSIGRENQLKSATFFCGGGRRFRFKFVSVMAAIRMRKATDN